MKLKKVSVKALRLTDADKVCPSYVRMVEAPYGGDYPKINQDQIKASCRILGSTLCRSKKDDEQE